MFYSSQLIFFKSYWENKGNLGGSINNIFIKCWFIDISIYITMTITIV